MNLEIQNNAPVLPGQNKIPEIFQKYQLLRIDMVSAITTLGKSTINLWVAQGKFPTPIHISPTVKVWRFEDITLWIDGNSNLKVTKVLIKE